MLKTKLSSYKWTRIKTTTISPSGLWWQKKNENLPAGTKIRMPIIMICLCWWSLTLKITNPSAQSRSVSENKWYWFKSFIWFWGRGRSWNQTDVFLLNLTFESSSSWKQSYKARRFVRQLDSILGWIWYGTPKNKSTKMSL